MAVMDEERKAALSRKMLIICAIVGTVLIVVIIITAAVIAALPEPVVISEGNYEKIKFVSIHMIVIRVTLIRTLKITVPKLNKHTPTT